MLRRAFFRNIAAIVGTVSFAKPALAARRGSILLQRSPLAGFQYYAGEKLWPLLTAGTVLALAREPENPHDKRAVRVDWRGQKLGYLPRSENAAAAQMLDRGEKLEASIAALRFSKDPWQRIELEVRLKPHG